MGRHKLGDTETVVLRFKLPKDLADKFRKRCAKIDHQSAVLRYLILTWLEVR